MSVTSSGRRLAGKLRPESSVFLLCDIQERFRPLLWRGETIINTSRYMTSVAKALDIPVVITQQYTKVFGDTVKDCFADLSLTFVELSSPTKILAHPTSCSSAS
jgi:hypothetical protein